jgi:ribose/xylose/arabinose/galactoside ABC-type transport system permease subunit
VSDFDDVTPLKPSDERITYRGPLKRLLISPEIGALIGAVVVWAFFWGNGDKFGTAGSTANFLDVAAPLGIMAVAISLLMIGGEYDLSAGVMTGASGVTIALMAKYFTDGGISLWVCIPAAFLLAGCVGWWNGFLVNKTGLPSFIVTLGSFFVIKGANLVFSKRINSLVNVSDVDKAHGYKFFKAVLGGENQFGDTKYRDIIFIIGGIAFGVLLIIGFVEQSLLRLEQTSMSAMFVAVVGAVAGVAGVLVLHRTDSINGNVLAGVIGLSGSALAMVFYSRARFQSRAPLVGALPETARPWIFLGLLGTGVASLAGQLFDRGEESVMLQWFPSWLRLVVAVVAGALPLWFFVRQVRRGDVEFRAKTVALIVVRLPIICLVSLTGIVSLFQLTTVQAVRAVLITVAGAGAATCLYRARSIAGKQSTKWFINLGVLMTACFIVVAFAVRADSSAPRFRGGIFATLLIGAALVLATTFIEANQKKRTLADLNADRFGKRIVMVGMVLGAIALGTRLLFSEGVFRMSVFWWLFFTAVGSFVLTKTKYGNWIFAVGGNKDAARATGVPADKVKTALFMATSMMGAFVGAMILMRLNSVQAQQGDGQEFEYIIAAVVGGNLMTGGYGSVIGASLGALIMAVSKNGIPAAQWNQDGRFIFLGAVLLVAVLVNNFVRKKANEQR